MMRVIQVEFVQDRKRSWWKPSAKPTLRDIGIAVSLLQLTEGSGLHARRDGCIPCSIATASARADARRIIPARFLKNPEWMHRHVEAPGMRRWARAEDEATR